MRDAWCQQINVLYRVTTFLENLEMSGILVIVRDYGKSQGNVRGVSGNLTMSGKWAPLY
jgi:hypothetical protein